MDIAGVFASFGLPIDRGVLAGGVGLAEFSPNGAALVEKSFFILRQFVTRLSLLRFGLVHSRRSPVPSTAVAWRRTLRKSAPGPDIGSFAGFYERSSWPIFVHPAFR
jgi:hypothetical protein